MDCRRRRPAFGAGQIIALRTFADTHSLTMTVTKIIDQDDRDLRPGQNVERGLERQTEPAGADQAENRRTRGY